MYYVPKCGPASGRVGSCIVAEGEAEVTALLEYR